MEECIVVEHAVKKFKDNIALNDISVSFERGKIHGVIGRNGSGKTVLFKCICGFMSLDSGRVIIDREVVKPAAPQDIGIIIEHPGFINSLSGFQNLKLLASINRRISAEEIKEVMLKVGLDPLSRKKVSKYSLGMRQRLGIAQAIMENPDILILDEPMNGLDKKGVEDVRKLLLDLKKEGKTIVMSSHYIEDINHLCDTLCELDNGEIVYRTAIDG